MAEPHSVSHLADKLPQHSYLIVWNESLSREEVKEAFNRLGNLKYLNYEREEVYFSLQETNVNPAYLLSVLTDSLNKATNEATKQVGQLERFAKTLIEISDVINGEPLSAEKDLERQNDFSNATEAVTKLKTEIENLESQKQDATKQRESLSVALISARETIKELWGKWSAPQVSQEMNREAQFTTVMEAARQIAGAFSGSSENDLAEVVAMQSPIYSQYRISFIHSIEKRQEILNAIIEDSGGAIQTLVPTEYKINSAQNNADSSTNPQEISSTVAANDNPFVLLNHINQYITARHS
jgi:hypothetical protein